MKDAENLLFLRIEQRLLLTQIAAGMTAPQIAKITDITAGAVNAKILRLKVQLEAENQANMVSIAYEKGYLVPSKPQFSKTFFAQKTDREMSESKERRQQEIEKLIVERIKAERLFFKQFIAKVTDNVTEDLRDIMRRE